MSYHLRMEKSPRADAADSAVALEVMRSLDRADAPVIVLDAELRYRYLNAAARSLVGPRDCLVDAPVLDGDSDVLGRELHDAAARVLGNGAAGHATVNDAARGRCFAVELLPMAAGVLLLLHDVTADRERQSTTRARAALTATQTSTFSLDAACGTLEWDESTGGLAGDGEGLPANVDAFCERVHPDDRAPLRDALARARNGAGLTLELRLPTSGGETRWVSLKLQSLVGQEEPHAQLIGACTDVTEIKRTELALRRQSRTMRTLADNAASCLFMIDNRGRPTYMNPAAVASTGYTLDEIRHRHLHDCIHWTYPDGAPYPRSQCPVVIATALRQPIKEAEDLFQRKDGSRFAVAYSLMPLDESDPLTDTVLEFRDITAQKEAESALHLADQRKNEYLVREHAGRVEAEAAQRRALLLADASLLFSSSLEDQGMLAALTRLCVRSLADWAVIDVVEEDGRTTRLGGAHRDPGKEALLAELEERYPQRVNPTAPASVVLQQGGSIHRHELTDEQIRETCVDDRHFQILRELGTRSAVIVPLIARDATLGVLSLVSGSTQGFAPADVELAAELGRRAALVIDNARLLHQTQRALRLRDDFLSVASHELRTPITALQLTVSALLQIATEEPTVASDKLAHRLMRVQRNAKRLQRLAEELLDVTLMDEDQLQIRRAEVDLCALTRDTIAHFESALAAAGCRVSFEHDDAVVGAWDALRLRQVVASLLDNALKFGAGQPIEVRVRAADGVARLEVEDHGIGIDTARLPFVFDRFERAVPATKYGGLGLGLYLARSIIRAHGGSIRVDSQPGRGARFTVELPGAETAPLQ